jgi:hypothetical protein
MSHTNQTGVTEKMQNLKISFDQINLSKKNLKKKKIKQETSASQHHDPERSKQPSHGEASWWRQSPRSGGALRLLRRLPQQHRQRGHP